MTRPLLTVLAGVNGAGKSSLLGRNLQHEEGEGWFNPDQFARELVVNSRIDLAHANVKAWNEGLRRLRHAIARHQSLALETTLGGRTITDELIRAAASHHLVIWYCGLSDAETHLRRIAFRVAHGGHPIPEAKVRERLITSPLNLIRLLPHLTALNVYDNSREAGSDGIVPDPTLLLRLFNGQVEFPTTPRQLAATPDWAKPILAAALE